MEKSEVKILVLDDEEYVRDNLVVYLEDAGYSVTATRSGEEALDISGKKRFHLGIIDMRLPGMDGNTAIKQAHTINPEMKFIIHTGSVGYRLSEELKRIGMLPDHVYLKPMDDLNELVEGIEKLAKRS